MEDDLKLLTHGELMFLGLQKLAYIRSSQSDGKEIFMIHAADGTELATVKNHAEARALILKNDMKPATLH